MLQFPIESVMLLNYWQRSSVDPNGYLLCLSNATLTLIGSEGAIVGSQATGKTCGKHALLLIFFCILNFLLNQSEMGFLSWSC